MLINSYNKNCNLFWEKNRLHMIIVCDYYTTIYRKVKGFLNDEKNLTEYKKKNLVMIKATQEKRAKHQD